MGRCIPTMRSGKDKSYKEKAIVAVAHSMLIAIYYVPSGSSFLDLGADYYNQFGTEKKR